MSDQTEPKSYTYRPLETPKTIRVLALQPVLGRLRSSELWATLCHVSLRDYHPLDGHGISYEAISYAWGKSTTSNRLFTDDGVLMIRDNLYAALKSFRFKTRVRYMWADAVCINQDDPVERSQQVSIMHDVYSQAQHVRVWLGESGNHECNLLLLRREYTKFQLWPYLARRLHVDCHVYEQLHHLLKLPWFTRRWVIQETTSATAVTFHCSHAQFDWAALDNILCSVFLGNRNPRLRHRSRGPGIEWSQLRRLHSMAPLGMTHNEFWQTPTLLNLLEQFDDCECEDGRDRIFALINLSVRRDNISVRPNYIKAVEEVYLCLAAQYLLAASPYAPSELYFHPFDLFYHAIARRSIFNSNMPSWVPDWRVPHEAARISFHELHCRQLVPGWEPEAQIKICSDDEGRTSLSIAGVLLGTFTGRNEEIKHRNPRIPTETLTSGFLSYTLQRKEYEVRCETLYGDVICLFHGATVCFILRPTSEDQFQLVGYCQEVDSLEGADLEGAERSSKLPEERWFNMV